MVVNSYFLLDNDVIKNNNPD